MASMSICDANASAPQLTSAWHHRSKSERPSRMGEESSPSWQQRCEHVLLANQRLKQRLHAQEDAHRKSLTVVKYEPSLPNNDVFTKELVEENRLLISRYRALELKLARIDNVRSSSVVSSSPRRSVDKSTASSRKKAIPKSAFPVKHASVQTVCDGNEDANASPLQQIAVINQDTEDRDSTIAPPKSPAVDVQFLVAELKQRLCELDMDLTRLREENELLRMERLHSDDELNPPVPHGQRLEDLQTQLRTKEQQQELEHLLNDRIRQMKILEEQFTHLQHKVRSKALLYKDSLDKIEQLSGELFDAKQTLLKQAEWLHAQDDRNAQLSMLEKEVHVLRRENATLNETVGMLSARPLDALNVQLEKKALQISLLDDEKSRLETKLQKASQDHRIVMQTNDKLRSRVDALTQQVETQLVELHELKRLNEQSCVDREVAQLQLQFYLSGDPVESKQLMEAVGRALKAMRSDTSDSTARSTQPSRAVAGGDQCFTQQGDGKSATGSLTQRRIEKMADISKLIQDDARAELRDLRISHHAQVHALQRQSRLWERRANEYLQELTRPLLTEPTQERRTEDPSNAKPLRKLGTDSLPSDLAVETLMSVRVFDLQFNFQTRGQGPKASEFVVFCDYFDFEPQHSPVFSGSSQQEEGESVAALDMEISYKLLVDRAFCKSPLATVLSVELHELAVATANVVGVAEISLQSLFMSANGSASLAIKLMDPTARVAIGSMRIALNLAKSTSRLFHAWMARDPAPRGMLPHWSSRSAGNASMSIRVVAMVLQSKAATPAATTSSFVKLCYRFMGHPATRCTVKTRGKPIHHGFIYFAVDQVKTFQIPSDAQFLDYLQRHEMVLQVEGHGGSKLGEAAVPFKRCSERETSGLVSVAITTSSADNDERLIGRVWIELAIPSIGSLATEALDASVVRPIVERIFGCKTLSTGSHLVDWRLFCDAIAMPPLDRAVRQLLREKLATSQSVLRLQSSTDSLRGMLDRAGITMSRSELSFVSGVLLPFGDDDDDDSSESVDAQHQQTVNRRLALIVATMDPAWSRVETPLRRHIELLNVLMTSYSGTSKQSDDERIEWGTFANRIRLPTGSTKR